MSTKKKQISVISALAEAANIGSIHRAKTFLTSVGFSVTMLACADPVTAQKPYPAGIIDLPSAISAQNPIGDINKHPWQNTNVDGLRVRTGWSDLEIADNVHNWPLIDDCLANALASGKFIGLGIISGTGAPPWLMGGVTFTDGSTTLNVAALTSLTANFTTDDVGRVIVCARFPAGTTIVSITSPTVVQTSAAANRTTSQPVTFSILARDPNGAVFRVLTAPDSGVMPVPWDPIAKAKWKELVIALGAKYDSNPQLGYMVMAGFQQTGECRLADAQADVDFFNANAIAAGYVATDTLSAGCVAWEATVKEIVDQYMISFPTTPLMITWAAPFPSDQGGPTAMADIVAWGVVTYPGRFGLMNAQLDATSSITKPAFSVIYDNAATEPTGTQFLNDTATPCNVARLSGCDGTLLGCANYGTDPCLSAYDAINNSFTAAVNIGCRFVETYEVDVNNPAYQTMLAIQGAALKAMPILSSTDLSVTVNDRKDAAVAGKGGTYTIVVTNAGAITVTGAVVTDNFPAILTGVTFTATQTGGASGFTASGTGNISDTVTMPPGSVITYKATWTISSSATGTLSDTATVTPPSDVSDSNLANNSATDTDTITVQADLKVTVTDGKKRAVAGKSDTYTIVVTNIQPSNVTGAVVTDNFPAILTGVTFTATQTGGASGFTASGTGNISDTVTMPPGSVITYKATGTISSSATGTLSDTATVTPPSGVTDPNLANNSATDTDTL